MNRAIHYSSCLAVAVLGLVATSQASAAGWFACGTLNQISSCQLASYPSAQYEYAIAYNSTEPLPTVCTYWNVGQRIYNRDAYMVDSDDPTNVMSRGGFIFYTGTAAADDDTCSSGAWRHRYWRVDADGRARTYSSNGCYGTNLAVYCRLR